jgi:cell division protein FtsB
LVKRVKFKTFIIIFILAGSYLFIFSENGILERRELQKKYNLLTERIANMKENNSSLDSECEKYRSGKFNNKDIIDSGFVYKTGKVMFINDAVKDDVKTVETAQDEFMISLKHLRIIWIIISILILLLYFLKEKDRRELADGSDFN